MIAGLVLNESDVLAIIAVVAMILTLLGCIWLLCDEDRRLK